MHVLYHITFFFSAITLQTYTFDKKRKKNNYLAWHCVISIWYCNRIEIRGGEGVIGQRTEGSVRQATPESWPRLEFGYNGPFLAHIYLHARIQDLSVIAADQEPLAENNRTVRISQADGCITQILKKRRQVPVDTTSCHAKHVMSRL